MPVLVAVAQPVERPVGSKPQRVAVDRTVCLEFHCRTGEQKPINPNQVNENRTLLQPKPNKSFGDGVLPLEIWFGGSLKCRRSRFSWCLLCHGATSMYMMMSWRDNELEEDGSDVSMANRGNPAKVLLGDGQTAP